MGTLRRSESATSIVYQTDTGERITLYKTTGFHLEMEADWPVGDAASWPEYRALIEAGSVIEEA